MEATPSAEAINFPVCAPQQGSADYASMAGQSVTPSTAVPTNEPLLDCCMATEARPTCGIGVGIAMAILVVGVKGTEYFFHYIYTCCVQECNVLCWEEATYMLYVVVQFV